MTNPSLFASDHRVRIDQEGDALNLLSLPVVGLIFRTSDLAPDFFDLQTGLAGAVFQKLINYRCHAVFLVPDDHDLGPRVTELAREYSNHPHIRIVSSENDASTWLNSLSTTQDE